MTLLSRSTIIIFFLCCFFILHVTEGVQIISKSKLQKCEKNSDSEQNLNCTTKIVLNMAVPSGSSGGEASIVAELVEVEENATAKMQTLRVPPVITVNKSAAYAFYDLTYIRDVPYKPEEFFVKTRKCKPDASANVVKICERLRDEEGHIVENTQPICCPCGPRRRMPSSCGNFFDKLTKGKANTAHCVRFPGDWFHVFGIGRRTLGFSVRIQVKSGNEVSEVVVGPENRTVISDDKFLRVSLIGDFAGYTSIPSFEDFYLVVPRQSGPAQPQDLGRNISMWMLLERVRFTLDGIECNKIGVSYEAFNQQPNFCSSPFWSCLHNQLWNFREADLNRISRNQVPLYGLEGRFERINQHPGAGSYSFSIGITEVLNTNILIELSATDVEYVYQRSPGKILSVSIPTFEALTQFGVATITTKNIGEVEASYSLTFNCSKDVTLMEEQYLIMKPNEITTRAFKIYPNTDQASKYFCAAILKDSDYGEVDRAECQFTTTGMVLDNGTQGMPFQLPETSISGFFDSIESLWNKIWTSTIEFITGKTCRQKCSGFFDFKCHIQYVCLSWVMMFGLFLAIFPTVLVLLWLLHQKGVFDPLYDWWENIFGADEQTFVDKRNLEIVRGHHHTHSNKHHKHEHRHPKHGAQYRRRISHEHKHRHSERDSNHFDYLHHVQKEKHKHSHKKNIDIVQHHGDNPGHYKHRKEGDTSKGLKLMEQKHHKERQEKYDKHNEFLLYEPEDG
ncbi:PREDICTED: protein HAPLESS 2 isoform X2 [Lupinus angustifolius]|uniref:protein HAPLESS 2 isoform X2 n=1 Tax=Lupinus angustifolius TaxID=3871 RepID=UPI00092F72A8|nr:PREDICTED: protein HAPLESS 2 isoform X2 [Lupinus angustifolius]